MHSGHRPPTDARAVLKTLREGKPTIPSDVEAVVQRATRNDPKDRYESARGFLNAFRRAIEKEHEDMLPPLPPPFWPRWALAVLLLAGVLAAGILLWPRPSQPSLPPLTRPTTFCLAMDLPLSGTEATAGREILHGIDLAIAQNPLPTGYRLKENALDDASQAQAGKPDPTVGVTNIQTLSQSTPICPNPIAAIGPFDSLMAVGEIPVAAEEHLLLLSPSNTAPCLTQKNYGDPPICAYDVIHRQGFPNTYARLPDTDIDQGYQDADFLWRTPNATSLQQSGLGARKIVIVGDEEVYGTQLAQSVIQRLQQAYGLVPVEVDCIKSPDEFNADPSCSLNPNVQAFSTDNLVALAAKIAKTHPDAIFFAGFPDRGAGLLRHQLGVVGLGQLPFVGGSALISDGDTLFTAASPYTANIYATFPAADPVTFSKGSEAEQTLWFKAGWDTDYFQRILDGVL